MKRPQLEHILRASGALTDETEIVILGSQSILGQYPDPPEALCRLIDAGKVGELMRTLPEAERSRVENALRCVSSL